MGIGIILQQLLKEKNTNVNEVATETGVSPSTLYSIIKRDSMKASINDLYKVAHYLGVTLDYFYSNYQAQIKTSHIVQLSPEANEVAIAYEKADLKNKNIIRQILDLPVLQSEAPAVEASTVLDRRSAV